ncbi:MAG TPA: hypothetical protein VNM90_08570 [Haliangium sp.]|nr:hypothetical protein [Haliangium sp.]
MTAEGRVSAESGMSARRLLSWGDLEDHRRRRARAGLAAWPPWVWAVLGGLLLCAEVARRAGAFGSAAWVDAASGAPAQAAGDALSAAAGSALGAAVAGASKLVLLVIAAGNTLVVFGTPFRLYWRHDAPLLGRLSIPGRSLFAVALVRSLRAAGRVLLVGVPGALALGAVPALGQDLALRHLAVAGACALMAGLLAPAMALLAGAMVASDKVQAALDSFGGEMRGPRTSWLGALPGVTATVVALVALGAAPWARGETASTIVGPPAMLLGASALLSVIAALWALRRSDAVMAEALREVVALDQERLAHVDLVGPSRIEALVARRWLGGGAAGAVFEKDARLLRRRYPLPFFFGTVGLISLVLVGWRAPADALLWAAAIAAGLGVYGAAMARRLVSPPTEHPRLLRSLPVGVAGAARAKRARVILWVACYVAPGAAVVVARAPAPVAAAVTLGLIAAASVALGLLLIRE